MADTDTLRDSARSIFEAGVDAADPARALRRALEAQPFPDARGRRILIAIGKAAPRMMAEALTHISGPHDALVVTHHENTAEVPGATVLRAGHPVPDAAGADAARQVMALLDGATEEDRVIALISGGGSALVPAPAGAMSLADKAKVNELLLAGGLDIVRMNLVRQQLSDLKGGGFLRHAAPAEVTAYILSDVIGDDLRAIASGPTVGPIGGREDAVALLKEEGLWDRLPDAARSHLETARDLPPLPEAHNHLIGSNGQSLDAMAEAARGSGWETRIVSDRLIGDVADAAETVLASFAPVERPTALLFGGETTVEIRGDGRGGRNQELALRVAMGAPDRPGWCFLSGGTDGRDGPTDAAGGVVDAGTASRIAGAGKDAAALLENNDSYAALDAAGDLLRMQATGTNVADLQVLLLTP
ncbi:glycerate kinase type-2 family protein [Litorisediminicola beolgyonensis]|uniref:Glycerate kinase n=1 Tax=Litorisediminicola beolgyonensis TaxID=1173614 RepID=A0ABW3ZD07_9RHOB